MTDAHPPTRPAPEDRWLPRLQIATTVLAVYGLVLMEWLFFVTKPSFMLMMSGAERLRVLLVTPLLPALGLALVLVVLWTAARLVGRPAAFAAARRLGWAVPAMLLACASLLLLDNFTHTLLRFGIGSTAGAWRLAYATLFVLGVTWIYRRLSSVAVAPPGGRARVPVLVAAGVLLLSLGGAVVRPTAFASSKRPASAVSTTRARLPNIVILASDGLQADHMSAYGYKRDTTPAIRRMLGKALVFENALPNGNITSASLTSMLTGKLPLETRVFEQSDILTGAASFEHLPGILRQLGYRSIHVGLRPYTDPVAHNMQNAFDASNFRDFRGLVARLPLPAPVTATYSSELYLLGTIQERISERLLHAFLVEPMTDPYTAVVKGSLVFDGQRVDEALRFIEETPEPAFVHLHLMGTHAPFWPREKVFSAETSQRRSTLNDLPPEQAKAAFQVIATDLYDDTVLDFDRYFGAFVERLRAIGELDNTLLVVTSDHGRRWSFWRVPLLFFFPGAERTGRVQANVQLIDIAPTVLAYLGTPIPPWMTGQSLLEGAPDRMRPIFSTSLRPVENGVWRLHGLGVAICALGWVMDVKSGEIGPRPVWYHTAPCLDLAVPDEEWVRSLLAEKLAQNGFPVSAPGQAGDGPAPDRLVTTP